MRGIFCLGRCSIYARTVCGARGEGDGVMPYNFFPLRSHCALRARARGWCVFILCLVAKNEARKHTKGQALWKPARRCRAPFAPSVGNFVSQGGAQRFCSAKFRVHGLKKAANTLGGTVAVLMAESVCFCRLTTSKLTLGVGGDGAIFAKRICTERSEESPKEALKLLG